MKLQKLSISITINIIAGIINTLFLPVVFLPSLRQLTAASFAFQKETGLSFLSSFPVSSSFNSLQKSTPKTCVFIRAAHANGEIIGASDCRYIEGIKVLYEDDDLIAVSKPAGIPVCPSSSSLASGKLIIYTYDHI